MNPHLWPTLHPWPAEQMALNPQPWHYMCIQSEFISTFTHSPFAAHHPPFFRSVSILSNYKPVRLSSRYMFHSKYSAYRLRADCTLVRQALLGGTSATLSANTESILPHELAGFSSLPWGGRTNALVDGYDISAAVRLPGSRPTPGICAALIISPSNCRFRTADRHRKADFSLALCCYPYPSRYWGKLSLLVTTVRFRDATAVAHSHQLHRLTSDFAQYGKFSTTSLHLSCLRKFTSAVLNAV
jgi:hypothetical protein